MLAKVKVLAATVWADTVDTYKRVKVYLIGIAIVVALFEWNRLKEALLAYEGKKEMVRDQKQDSQLKTKEDAASQQADDLVKQAQQLPGQQPTVQPDWYKDQK